MAGSTTGTSGSSSGDLPPDPDPSTTGDTPDPSTSSTSADPSTTGDTSSSTSGSTTDAESTGAADESTSTGSTAVCGDGVVEGDEVCDDAGESATCNADCTTSTCGDGVVNVTANEECDGGDACNAACVSICAGFSADSFAVSDLSFTDESFNTAISMAWDGVSYWSAAGGGTSARMAEYDAAGVHQGTINPGPDFRSLFTKGEGIGPLYARGYNDATIWVEDTPGTFVADVTLAASMPGLHIQAAVVWDASSEHYIGITSGTVLRWDAAGNFLGSTVLDGFGIAPHQHEALGNSPYQMAWAERCILTYSDGQLSAWDHDGNRVDTADLLPMFLAEQFSLSYANGMVWLSDGSTWHGTSVF